MYHTLIYPDPTHTQQQHQPFIKHLGFGFFKALDHSWSEPTTILIVPILSLVLGFCIKHSVEEKISSHLGDVVNWDMEIKLNEKSGTYKTFLRIKLSLKTTVPNWEAVTESPLGSLTTIDLIWLYDAKFDKEKQTWFAALESKHIYWK